LFRERFDVHRANLAYLCGNSQAKDFALFYAILSKSARSIVSCSKKNFPCEGNTIEFYRKHSDLFDLINKHFLGITIFPNTRIGRGISVVTYNSNANKVEWRFFNFLERDLSKLNYSYAPYSANMDDANSFSFGSDDGSFLSFWHKKFVLLKKLGLLSVSSEEWGFTILTNTIDSTYEDLKLHNPNYDDYFYENQAKKIERAGCEIRYRYKLYIVDPEKSNSFNKRLTFLKRYYCVEKLKDNIFLS
jgi:hypothetical protein